MAHRIHGRRREHLFFVGLAIALAITVFAGFARTYYLRRFLVPDALMPLLHLHGIVFTAWFILLLTQTTLVATHRTDIHRRLGLLGMALAAGMVALGSVTATIRAGQGAAPPGIPPLAFLAIPLADMVMFGSLVAAAFLYRRHSDIHKRLMVLATVALMPAPIARLPGVMGVGPLGFFGLTDLFIVACVIYDLVTLHRIHKATLWGGLALIASQPLRLVISGTPQWMTFAEWLVTLGR